MIDRRVSENVRTHDRSALTYERRHGEIFNQIEQSRLRWRLRETLEAVRSGGSPPHALDLGAGTGNVTRHLLELGARVTAADVSARSLEVLRRRVPEGAPCRTVVLTGGLSALATMRFDLVAMYSLLHHVPDHLALLRQLAALVLPGGVIYIDHEATPAVWKPDRCLEQWRRHGPTVRARIAAIGERLSWSWVRYRLRRLHDRRATLEGDIHVWPDDHIEWDDVTRTLGKAGFETVSVVDHLQYRRDWDRKVYDQLKDTCADTRSLIARRTRTD